MKRFIVVGQRKDIIASDILYECDSFTEAFDVGFSIEVEAFAWDDAKYDFFSVIDRHDKRSLN